RDLGDALVPHAPDGVGTWADEGDVAFLADFGKVGVFGQEPVSGVDRVGVGDFGGTDEAGDVEVTLGACGGADAKRLVGGVHVEAVAVRFTVHGDGLDTEFAARTDDADGDFTP